jgi:hypothetical protein
MLLRQTEDARLIGGNPGLPCVGMEVEETPTRGRPPFLVHKSRRQAFQGGNVQESFDSSGGYWYKT